MRQRAKNHVVAKALRLAAVSVALGITSGPMEAWAYGNIFYNFSFIGIAGNVSGQFEVQPGVSGDTDFPDLIVGINGTVSGFTNGSGSFNTLLNPGVYANNDNWFSSASPWLTLNGVSFQSDGTNFVLFNSGTATWRLANDDGMSTGTLAVSLSQ